MISCLFIAALWSPAGQGLASWLSCMWCFHVLLSLFYVVSWVRYGTWLYRFLIFAFLLSYMSGRAIAHLSATQGPWASMRGDLWWFGIDWATLVHFQKIFPLIYFYFLQKKRLVMWAVITTDRFLTKVKKLYHKRKQSLNNYHLNVREWVSISMSIYERLFWCVCVCVCVCACVCVCVCLEGQYGPYSQTIFA